MPIFLKRKLKLQDAKSFTGCQLMTVSKREQTHWSDHRAKALTPALCRRVVSSASTGEPLEIWEARRDLIRNWSEKGHIGCGQDSQSRHYPFSLMTKSESPLSFQSPSQGFPAQDSGKKVQTHSPLEKLKCPSLGSMAGTGDSEISFFGASVLTFKKMGMTASVHKHFANTSRCKGRKPGKLPS